MNHYSTVPAIVLFLLDLMSAVLHAEQVSNCHSNSIVPPGPNECCATCRAGE